MEDLLSCIADEPISATAKKGAYQLILRIIKNLLQAAEDDDRNLVKYKWVRAHTGSALRGRVVDVSPLFRQLLEALGFRFVVGRPPHLDTGSPQEYMVFSDDVRLEDLAYNAQLIEAVVGSIPEEDGSPTGSARPETQSSFTSRQQQSHSNGQDSCQATVCSRPVTPSARPDAELEELRKEQQERYRQRGHGSSSSSSRPSEGRPDTDSGRDDSGGSWFWNKLWWGGGNSSNHGDNSRNSQGRSTSSRTRPPNNRMMTLRDLPKPQRRG